MALHEPTFSLRPPPWLLLLAAWLPAPAALGGPAEDKKACLASYESSQELRRQGSLRAAREQFAICARPVCPKALSVDCTKWLEEVQSTMPTVVIEGRDASGGETIAIRVLLDGKPLVERLDGRAIEVDPGQHTFRYEYGGEHIEERIVIREGERNRKLTASFAKATPAPSAAPTGASVPPPAAGAPRSAPLPGPEEPSPSRPVRPVTYALAGVSLLGFAGFAYFGLTGNSKAQQLERDCLPSCTDDQVKPLKTSYLLADISLGVGLLGGGLALLTHALRPAQTQSARVNIDIAPSPGGGAVLWGGKF
jgi:hypothetical protein